MTRTNFNRRSLLALGGLGLLSPAALAACSSPSSSSGAAGKSAGSSAGAPNTANSAGNSAGTQALEKLRVHIPSTLAYAAPMTSFGQHGILDNHAKKRT